VSQAFNELTNDNDLWYRSLERLPDQYRRRVCIRENLIMANAPIEKDFKVVPSSTIVFTLSGSIHFELFGIGPAHLR